MLSDLFYPYQLGGAERQFYELAKELAKRHEVWVFTMSIRGCKGEEKHKGIKIKRVGIPHPRQRRSVLRLAFFFPFAALALLKELRRFDLIHANQAASLLGFLLCFSKRPFIATIHDLYLNKWKFFVKFPLSFIGRLLEFLFAHAPRKLTITVSVSSAKKLIRCGDKRVAIIPNGLNVKRGRKAKKENLVVYVGRLVRYKKVDTLIRAMRVVQERMKARLVIIGEGPERKRLELLAKRLGCDCSFLGYVSEKEKFEILRRAKVFCNLSLIEGFGISLLEAASCRAAIIARDLPCYRELFSEDACFFLSDEEADDPKFVAKAIIELLRNETIRKKLAKKAMQVASKYSWNEIARRVDRVYRTVLR